MNTADNNHEPEKALLPFSDFAKNAEIAIAIDPEEFASLDQTTIPDGGTIDISDWEPYTLPDELTLARKGDALFAICRWESRVNQFIGFGFSLRDYILEKAKTARLLQSEGQPIIGAHSQGGPTWFYLDWQLQFQISESPTAILGTISQIGTTLHQETCKRLEPTNAAADSEDAQRIHQPALIDCSDLEQQNASELKVGNVAMVLLPRKKKQPVTRNIPTQADFEKVIASMRGQRSNDSADEGADFAEFLGLAGVGQAEASAITWEDVDFEKNRIHYVRVKTDRQFSTPIYAWLRPLLERRREAAGGNPTGRIFSLKGCSCALARAAKRLELPHISPRNLRSMRIVAMLDAGVDVKQVSEWQGHHDGGKLILDTYSEVIRSNRNAYEAEQLARAEGRIVRFTAAA